MKRIVGLIMCLLSLALVSCSGNGGGTSILGSIVQAKLQDAYRADLSGQQSVFTGTLGSGITFTFPAVKGGDYLIQIDTTDSGDKVDFDVVGDDGTPLNAKSVDSGNGFIYNHRTKSQHVLVLCRPYNPLDTNIEITRLTVTGTGSYPTDRVHVNFIIAGKFTGYGSHNDLVSTADQAAFTDEVMAKVQALYNQTGITISYEGFYYSGDQVRQLAPGLIAPDDQTICSAGETTSSNGFQLVATQGLDQWGQLGFAESDPNYDRGHGINVFLIHHFTNDGTVGLSPRPGILVGNGDETALCAGAFLQSQGSLVPRTPDQVATVVAHEMGHFLGLLHTTTFMPDSINPTEAVDDGIQDTPKCTVLTDVNGDGRVGLGDGCPDEGNIMFYMAGNQTVFTPGQTTVIKQVLSAQEH